MDSALLETSRLCRTCVSSSCLLVVNPFLPDATQGDVLLSTLRLTGSWVGVLQVGVLALDALLRALPSLSVFLRSAPFMGHGGLMHATSMNLEVRPVLSRSADGKAPCMSDVQCSYGPGVKTRCALSTSAE